MDGPCRQAWTERATPGLFSELRAEVGHLHGAQGRPRRNPAEGRSVSIPSENLDTDSDTQAVRANGLLAFISV